jgi:valyl-tRNA synthetase
LYTIARPDKNGVPIINLSSSEYAQPEYSHDVVYSGETQMKVDRVLMKVISERTPFKPIITERLRSLMKAKLANGQSIVQQEFETTNHTPTMARNGVDTLVETLGDTCSATTGKRKPSISIR